MNEQEKAWHDAGYKRAEYDMDRFWSKVEKTPGCWLWKAAKSKGYGAFHIRIAEATKRGRIPAHRFSYFLAYGTFPNPIARHRCDNPSCVRPDHILAGTTLDNVRDKYERGRAVIGEAVKNALLKNDQVREIRRLLSLGLRPCEIAPQFKVRRDTISKINTGASYARIK